MPTDAFDIGDLVRRTATFTVDGVATDPTAVTYRMTAPDGTVTVYVYGTDAELVKESAGVFHVDWTVAKPGRHFDRFEGTGAAHGAVDGEFWARRKYT